MAPRAVTAPQLETHCADRALGHFQQAPSVPKPHGDVSSWPDAGSFPDDDLDAAKQAREEDAVSATTCSSPPSHSPRQWQSVDSAPSSAYSEASFRRARLPLATASGYSRIGVLGEGSYATVYKVLQRSTGNMFALKIVCPQSESGTSDVMAEIANSVELQHPNLVKVHGFWQERDKYHMVMEFCTEGNLHSCIKAHVVKETLRNRGFRSGLGTRTSTRFLCHMLSGVAFLHDNGYIHRDIKPGNFLLQGTDSAAVLKLGDFGFACRLPPGQKLYRRVGTPLFVAPEVLKHEYDNSADVWSLGVTAYAMCTNRLPFRGVDMEEYLENVADGQVVDRPDAWKQHPKRLHTLVLGLMKHDPMARPTAAQVLSDNTWLKPVDSVAEQVKAFFMPASKS